MTSFDWKWKARLILIHKDVRATPSRAKRGDSLSLKREQTNRRHENNSIMYIVLWSFEEGGIKQTNVAGL